MKAIDEAREYLENLESQMPIGETNYFKLYTYKHLLKMHKLYEAAFEEQRDDIFKEIEGQNMLIGELEVVPLQNIKKIKVQYNV